MYFAHAEVATDRSGIKGGCRGMYAMMRTSLRTRWRTVGHDDLDLRLRRALAHGSFDTSSIFHRPGRGVGNTRTPLPAATQSSVLCTLFRYPRVRVADSLSRSSQDPLPAGRLAPLILSFICTDYFDTCFETALLP